MRRERRAAKRQVIVKDGKRKGRVLAVRLGSNPNSSSLGVDVTLLLAGGAAVSLVSLLGGALARFALGRRRGSGAAGPGATRGASTRHED